MYFAQKLQGIDTTKLDVPEMVFHAINAFSHSTVNQGVGGTPRMALVNSAGVHEYSLRQTRAVGNLSGAYLAEFSPGLGKTATLEAMRFVIMEDNGDVSSIAQMLDLNESAVTSLLVPYSVWQERANLPTE